MIGFDLSRPVRRAASWPSTELPTADDSPWRTVCTGRRFPGGGRLSVSGPVLEAAREVALRWVLAPAAVTEKLDLPALEEGAAAGQLRAALRALQGRGDASPRLARAMALLDRIGWPGEPLRPAELGPLELAVLRRGALRQLAAAAGTIDESATLSVDHGRSWDAGEALGELDQARTVLEGVGWHADGSGTT